MVYLAQELQLMEERVFIKSDMEIIDYFKRKDRVESRVLFRYITGYIAYDKEVEVELRDMLRFYGYRLGRMREVRTIKNKDPNRPNCFFSDISICYYSISQYKRPGCHPCGIPENYPWMSRCYHWKNCHYGLAGKCQLAQITMN